MRTASAYEYVRLAERQINLGNPRGAIEQLRRALSADPEHVLAHAYLALCLHDTGQKAAAREECEIALRLAPENGFVRYAAGTVALHQGRLAEAEAHLVEARRLTPSAAYVYRQLAHLYGETDRNRLVRKTLEEGLQYSPEDSTLIAALGTHFMKKGNIAEAEEKALAALRNNPEDCDGHVLLGQIRFRQGDVDAARAHAVSALRRDATHQPALHLMCLVKTRHNPLIGLWWRYAVMVERLGRGKTVLAMLVLAIGLIAFVLWLEPESKGLVALLKFGANAFWIATAVGGQFFEKALQRELATVKPNPDF